MGHKLLIMMRKHAAEENDRLLHQILISSPPILQYQNFIDSHTSTDSTTIDELQMFYPGNNSYQNNICKYAGKREPLLSQKELLQAHTL